MRRSLVVWFGFGLASGAREVGFRTLGALAGDSRPVLRPKWAETVLAEPSLAIAINGGVLDGAGIDDEPTPSLFCRPMTVCRLILDLLRSGEGLRGNKSSPADDSSRRSPKTEVGSAKKGDDCARIESLVLVIRRVGLGAIYSGKARENQQGPTLVVSAAGRTTFPRRSSVLASSAAGASTPRGRLRDRFCRRGTAFASTCFVVESERRNDGLGVGPPEGTNRDCRNFS